MLINEGVWGAETHMHSGIVVCADAAGALRAMTRASQRMLLELHANVGVVNLEGVSPNPDCDEVVAPRILERGVFTGSLDRQISAAEADVFNAILDEVAVGA